jgi:hypothetical protein
VFLVLDSNDKLWEIVVSVAAISNASSNRPKDGPIDYWMVQWMDGWRLCCFYLTVRANCGHLLFLTL